MDATFDTRTDERISIRDHEFDKSRHYKGYRYPGDHWDFSGMRDISNHLPVTKKKNGTSSFLLYMVDPKGLVHTPMNKRDYNCGKLTAIKLGRYLKTFFDLSEVEIKDIVDSLSLKTIHIDTQFRMVYDKSARHAYSCMAGKFMNWRYHPVEVYDAGDLAIAYTLNNEGLVTNRAIVWPDRKFYIRCYGEASDTFEARLKEMGYTQDSCKGARLKMIAYPEYPESQILAPYFDGAGSASITPDGNFYLGTMDNHIKYFSSNEQGYQGYEKVRCELTGKTGWPHQMMKALHPYNGYEGFWDPDLGIDEHGYANCLHIRRDWYTNGTARNFVQYARTCGLTNKLVHTDDCIINVNGGAQYVSLQAFAERYHRDFFTGELIPLDEAVNFGAYNWTRAETLTQEYVPDPVRSTNPYGINVYAKLAELAECTTLYRDDLSGEIRVVDGNFYNIGHGGYTRRKLRNGQAIHVELRDDTSADAEQEVLAA